MPYQLVFYSEFNLTQNIGHIVSRYEVMNKCQYEKGEMTQFLDEIYEQSRNTET